MKLVILSFKKISTKNGVHSQLGTTLVMVHSLFIMKFTLVWFICKKLSNVAKPIPYEDGNTTHSKHRVNLKATCREEQVSCSQLTCPTLQITTCTHSTECSSKC